MTLLRIIPNGLKCQGTKVVMEDGTAIPGVTGITLRCEVNDIWKAMIEVNVEPPTELLAEMTLLEVDAEGEDKTSLSDTSRVYRTDQG